MKHVTRRFLLATLVAVVFGCATGAVDRRPAGHHVTEGRGGIVVSEDSIATEVGVAVLRAGGNAVDAAVATAFALAVALPRAGNIGGGGFLIAYDPTTAEYWALDFRETAPMASTEDMYEERAVAGDEQASRLGPLASGIPGTPAGLRAAWERGGSRPWAELVAPAVELAEDGYPVGDTLASYLERESDGLGRYPSTRAVFFNAGRPFAAGDRLVQAELAQVLAVIAGRGADGFYSGPIAKRLVMGVTQAGGNWTLEDLASYRPLFREPVRVAFGTDASVELVTMPPPSSASAVFAQTVALLEAQGALTLDRQDPTRAAAFIEALRVAFADRNRRLGDPDRMPTSPDELISPEYLADRVALLPARPPGDSRRLESRTVPEESPNTTHIVVMDAHGGVVSLTTTLNASFGSKFIVPGTGVLLNNEMDDFDTRPGKPNLYDLVGTGVNRVAPGARMLSSMAPTIIERDGHPWIALGARGGPRILTAVLQTIWHRVYDDMDLSEAVAAPRIHHQWLPDRVYFERCCPVPEGLRARLVDMGYVADDKAQIARVVAAEYLGGGRYLGVCDPRTAGRAAAPDPASN